MSTARILIIGNEVLSGEVADRNIHFLAQRLTELGTRVVAVRVVPDEDDAIVSGVREALPGKLLVTGGIGPTHDDRTRLAVAQALELPLVTHPEAEESLRRGYGSGITEAERAMALLPAGARLVAGRRSGVYGFVVGSVYVFPGVPDLLVDVFAGVEGDFRGEALHRIEIITRRKEGDFATALAALADEAPRVAIGSYPVRDAAGWSVRLILRGNDLKETERLAARVREIVGGDRT